MCQSGKYCPESYDMDKTFPNFLESIVDLMCFIAGWNSKVQDGIIGVLVLSDSLIKNL